MAQVGRPIVPIVHHLSSFSSRKDVITFELRFPPKLRTKVPNFPEFSSQRGSWLVRGREYRKFFFQNSFRIVDTMTMITIKRSRVIRRETIELVDRESTFSAEFRSGADSLALLGP